MKRLSTSRSTILGNSESFTGHVQVDTIQSPGEQVAYSCGHVRFAPGARTAWHSHPKGQTLYVTDGVGRIARMGEDIIEILPGDVVFFAPNEKHWHGAAPDRFMAHIAIAEADLEGVTVTWGAQVTDEEYQSGS